MIFVVNFLVNKVVNFLMVIYMKGSPVLLRLQKDIT